MIRVLDGPITRIERWALIGGLALAAALMWPLRHYQTDDTFIHLQYATHLAHGQGLVFNLGERVYGCTSPLWVTLIADGVTDIAAEVDAARAAATASGTDKCGRRRSVCSTIHREGEGATGSVNYCCIVYVCHTPQSRYELRRRPRTGQSQDTSRRIK